MRLTYTFMRLRDMTKNFLPAKTIWTAAKRYRYADMSDVHQAQILMSFSRSRVTPHQIFLTKVIACGVGILIGMALWISIGVKPMYRMNADSTYSPAPMYGAMHMPSSGAARSQAAQATSSAPTRRGTREQYWRRNPRSKAQRARSR